MGNAFSAITLPAASHVATALHAAIVKALRDSRAYGERGILVSPLLTATKPLDAPPALLHSAVYTLFCALPHRLVRGSTMLIATEDVDGGIELVWECREEPAFGVADLHASLRGGPHGDLVDIALRALESFCDLRAGSVETMLVPAPASPQFPRGDAVLRRVTAFLPASREDGLTRKLQQRRGAALG